MTDEQFKQVLAGLTGRRDKHISSIARALRCSLVPFDGTLGNTDQGGTVALLVVAPIGAFAGV